MRTEGPPAESGAPPRATPAERPGQRPARAPALRNGPPWLAWAGLLLVLAVGLGLRLARLAEVRAAPDFAHPAVDAAFHDWWARAVAGLLPADPLLGRDPALLERAYLRPPGYPLALAAVYALSGGSYLAARVFGLVLGLVAAGLLWFVLRRVRGPAAGLLGGLALACHWLPLYFEGELHATALAAALLLGATAAFALWFERESPRRALALGLLLGLAAGVLPNTLFVLAATLALGTLEVRRRGARWRAFALPLAAGAALAILPITARNLAVSGEPVLISTNAGINLYIGNHPGANGLVAAHLPGIGPFETCFDYPEVVRRVEQRVGQPLTDREVSAWFRGRALEWIGAEPRAALALLGRKLWLLLGPHEISHNKELALERAHSRVLARLPFSFALLLAGALVGLALALGRERGDPVRALAVFAALASAAWLLSLLPFFAAARYRVPVLPWLVLLSALGVVDIARAFWARRMRTALLGAGALAALGALFSASPYAPAPNAAKWHHDRGRALLQGGEPERALAELEAALAADPARTEAELSLANALAQLGRGAEAEAAYRRVLERRPRDRDALHNLAVVLAERGEFGPAAELFERALARHPWPGPTHLNLARAREALGDPEAAREHYRRALEHLPGQREAQRSLRRLEKAGAGAEDSPR